MPKCGKEVSTQAASCPHCGAPISPPQEIKVVTERTAKSYKGLLVLSVIVFLLGFCSVNEKGDTEIASWMMLLGILGFIVTEIAIWWQHD